jgi:hypothetical protein
MHARAHTHRDKYNTCWFFTATVVSRTRGNVTLHVHCLSCFSKFLSKYTNSSLSEYVDKNLGSTQVFCSAGRSVNELSSTRKEDALYQSLRSSPLCISDRFMTQPVWSIAFCAIYKWSNFHQWHSAGCLFHCVVFVLQLVLYFSTSLLFRVWL